MIAKTHCLFVIGVEDSLVLLADLFISKEFLQLALQFGLLISVGISVSDLEVSNLSIQLQDGESRLLLLQGCSQSIFCSLEHVLALITLIQVLDVLRFPDSHQQQAPQELQQLQHIGRIIGLQFGQNLIIDQLGDEINGGLILIMLR